MYNKGVQIGQAMMGMRVGSLCEVRGGRRKQLILPDVKTYYKAMVIKCDNDKTRGEKRSMKQHSPAQRQTHVFIKK